MPVYEYTALREDGESITGILTADTPREARDRLRTQKLMATSVEEVREVLARGALTPLVSSGYHLRPGLIEGAGPAVFHFLEVAADVVGVNRLIRLHGATFNIRLVDEDDWITLKDDVADGHRDGTNDAAAIRLD